LNRPRGKQMDYNELKLILKLARFRFLIPGLLIYTLGALLAVVNGAILDPIKFLFGYAIFGTAHLSVSFSNDYFDREADRTAKPTPFSGGSGILVQHPELSRFALRFAIFLIIISIVTAILFDLVYSYGPFFLALVILGSLLGWFYTAPPLKLAYRGLGEVSTILATGLIMPAMGYYVMGGTIDARILALSFPLMCYALFFILNVELPDVEVDRSSGKANLMTHKGRKAGIRLSVIATLAATVLFAIFALLGALRPLEMWFFVLLSAIPLIAASYGLTMRSEEPQPIVRQVKLNFCALLLILTIAVGYLAILT
jgi:1,4-dihydroxy-2-naphthoate octaprenyltransferase